MDRVFIKSVIDEHIVWLTSIPAKKDRDMIMNDLRQIVLEGVKWRERFFCDTKTRCTVFSRLYS